MKRISVSGNEKLLCTAFNFRSDKRLVYTRLSEKGKSKTIFLAPQSTYTYTNITRKQRKFINRFTLLFPKKKVGRTYSARVSSPIHISAGHSLTNCNNYTQQDREREASRKSCMNTFQKSHDHHLYLTKPYPKKENFARAKVSKLKFVGKNQKSE